MFSRIVILRMHFKNKQKFTKGWEGGKDALASAKTFNVKP